MATNGQDAGKDGNNHPRKREVSPQAAPKTGGRGARFGAAMTGAAERLNASVDFDRKLLSQDIRGSQSHARMLVKQGLITEADGETICAGLDQVKAEIETGALRLDPALEDIHMNVETRLTALIGDPARRLHTGRSRNDQVCTDLRLYCREATDAIIHAIDLSRAAFVRKAAAYADTLIPGYTHLQRAQVVTVGHHMLAYAEMLGRDRSRLVGAAKSNSYSPWGAGLSRAVGFPRIGRTPPRPLDLTVAPHKTAWIPWPIGISPPSWSLTVGSC